MNTLAEAGMPVICHQNEWALENLDNPLIVAWMHGDEPDNAQAWPKDSGKTGWGPPIAPKVIVEGYRKIRAADPSRPIMLNLGRSVAVTHWGGRGVRSGHTEDYPEYIKGSDIVSFDVYPVSASEKEVKGNLWYVPMGVDRLREWSNDETIVWNCIEASPINNPNTVPTGHQIRSEVWMSIIHGSTGLIYFVHQLRPEFNESHLLSNKDMLADVTAINQQIHGLAPVINSPTLADAVTVASANADVPIDVMTKQYRGAHYVFAAAARDDKTSGAFVVDGITGATSVEVIGENRTLKIVDGVFTDNFDGYGVHLYKIGG